MKAKKSGAISSSNLNSHLAAYSATAGAALLAAPAVHAELSNITSFNMTSGGTGGSVPGVNASHSNVSFRPQTAGGGSLVNFRFNRYDAGSFQIRGPNMAVTAGGSSLVKLGLAATVKNQRFSGNAHTHAANEWNGGGTGYLGFKSRRNSKTYYGWLHVKMSVHATNPLGSPGFASNTFLNVKAIAVNGDPGVYGAVGFSTDNVRAGISAVPEPVNQALAGLGLLAVGVAGIKELRRRRKEAAKN